MSKRYSTFQRLSCITKLFVLNTALIVGACSTKVTEKQAPQNEVSPAAYQCNNNMVITAKYIISNIDHRVLLTVDNTEFELYSVMSASGAKYATEQGLHNEKGLVWWTSGTEGSLYHMVLDHAVEDPLELITLCEQRV